MNGIKDDNTFLITDGERSFASEMMLWVKNYKEWFNKKESQESAEAKLLELKCTEAIWRIKLDTLSRLIKFMEQSTTSIIVLLIAAPCLADTVIVSDSPTIVRNAEIREAIRQDSTWTSENIAKNPYLFLQDQMRNCDKLKAKIDAQNITLVRMEKKAKRAVEEAESSEARYSKFLSDVKAAYKAANGVWPVSVNGYSLNEEEMNEKIADAMERLELAKKERSDNSAIVKKISIRKGVLKTKKREAISLRLKLSQQAEQVKMNAALAEIGELKSSLGVIKDMMIEIDEDPTKLSVEDMTAEDPNAKRNKKVNSFLNN